MGHLDKAGNFTADDAVGVPLDSPPGIKVAWDARLTNFPADKTSELVYEYRSGRLVKGTLINDGHFIPERGSEIMSFGRYIPIKGNLRIYNLPGRFVDRARKK